MVAAAVPVGVVEHGEFRQVSGGRGAVLSRRFKLVDNSRYRFGNRGVPAIFAGKLVADRPEYRQPALLMRASSRPDRPG